LTRAPACLALAALLAVVGGAAAQPASEDELKALRARIERLKDELAAAEGARAEAADELRASETAISEANRSLRELALERDRLRAEAARITAESRAARAALDARQSPLERLVAARYVARDGGVLRALLSGADPQAISRRLVYETYVARAQADLIRSARAELARLAELESAARAKAEERAAVEARARAERAALRRTAAERREVAARIAGDVRKARRDLDAAQKNETRLARLVQELARAVRPPPRPGAAPPSAPAVGGFGKLKGRLAPPVRGTPAARAAAPQRPRAPSAKGLFFRAPEGDEVHAVAAGRVVFADWLRGYGNLLIVDHGDDYLSIYANNESVLKRVGDAVHAGDVVATVGASGGNESSGLYFELRHQGRAFDPVPWLGSK
jgi:septal ring factor EnvC (AmiA/AmiB activator)